MSIDGSFTWNYSSAANKSWEDCFIEIKIVFSLAYFENNNANKCFLPISYFVFYIPLKALPLIPTRAKGSPAAYQKVLRRFFCTCQQNLVILTHQSSMMDWRKQSGGSLCSPFSGGLMGNGWSITETKSSNKCNSGNKCTHEFHNLQALLKTAVAL